MKISNTMTFQNSLKRKLESNYIWFAVIIRQKISEKQSTASLNCGNRNPETKKNKTFKHSSIFRGREIDLFFYKKSYLKNAV